MLKKVALVRCSGYDIPDVQNSLSRGFELLGGIDRFLPADGRVLLKPNFLAGEDPEKAITTHPAVLTAIANLFRAAGVDVELGDSPGLGNPLKVAEKCGMGPLYAQGVIPADFETIQEFAYDQGKVGRVFPMAKAVLDAGLVVDCAKLKTHAMQYYTGAVKNLYGCLVGLNKAKLHLQFPDRDVFADYLLDLYGAVNPGLTIIDAVIAMEGNGPRSGKPRHVGAMILSEDALAADVAALALTGINPRRVPVIQAAKRRQLEPVALEQIELVGDELSSLQVNDFVAPSTSASFGPASLQRALRNWLIARPVVRQNCIGCGECARICPPGIIRVSGKQAQIDVQKCITCYCCHEACPHDAIDLKAGFMARRIARFLVP